MGTAGGGSARLGRVLTNRGGAAPPAHYVDDRRKGRGMVC